jgi:hypothetical protein
MSSIGSIIQVNWRWPVQAPMRYFTETADFVFQLTSGAEFAQRNYPGVVFAMEYAVLL